MSYSIEITNLFEKQLKRLAKKFPSLKTEFAELVSLLKENPEQGKNLGNNCFKIRLAIASKGKGKKWWSKGYNLCTSYTNKGIYSLHLR